MENKTTKFKIEKPQVGHVFDVKIEEEPYYFRVNVDGDQVDYLPEKKALKFLFSKKINGTKIGGITIPDEITLAIEKAKNQTEKRKNEEEKRIKMMMPARIRWAVGGDSHRIAVCCDTGSGLMTQPTIVGEIEKALETRFLPAMREQSKKIPECETGMYTVDGWWEIPIDAPIIQEALNKEQGKEEEKAEREEEKLAIFEKARKTGEKQLLYTTGGPCQDHAEECDWDIVKVYALPDGKRETVYQHTW